MQIRCGVAIAIVASLAVGASAASAGSGARLFSSHGIGSVRFGTAKPRAVHELSGLFGQPSRRFVSDGCGPTYTEVEWGHLYAEFRQGRFSGFRYLRGAWLRSGVTPGSATAIQPRLVTAKQITLGSTLRQARSAYGHLRPVGTGRWETPDGLIFYDNAQRYPDPPESLIIEIKSGTCGDW